MTIPLYFQFRIPVHGRGFAADVRIRGRVTCLEEYGATCIYGVNPGGLAAGGEDMNAAYLDFRLGLAATLIDLAKDAGSLADFKDAVQDFVQTTDPESVTEWASARSGIRGRMKPAESAKLRRETDLLPIEISVERMRPYTSSPTMNPEPDTVTPAHSLAG